MKHVLVVGPLPKPTTGVSLANQVVVDNLSQKPNFKVRFINTSYNKFEESLGSFSISKLLFYLKINLHSYKIFASNIVYITPGQTFFGVLKYAWIIFLTRLLRKELIIHVHGNYLGKEYVQLKGLKKRLFKLFVGRASKGIVLSESLKENMSPFIKDNAIFVLYNFVEDYLFVKEEKITKKANNSKPKLIFLSNLMEEKGIFDLLEAFKILEEEGFEYEAKIAGNIDAKFATRTNQYFQELKNTSYVGVVSGNDKKELLLWANTFALPTYYTMEGQPISILEAMATGNLVLTTDHAGIPDVFKDGVNGFYVEKQKPQSIANKIKSLTKDIDKTTHIRNRNYKLAKEKYRVNQFINNIAEIFEA